MDGFNSFDTEYKGLDTSNTPAPDYSPNNIPEPIKRRSTWVRGKNKLIAMREALGQGLEVAGITAFNAERIAQKTQYRQDAVEDQFDAVQRASTETADWGGEIIVASDGEPTLQKRLVRDFGVITSQIGIDVGRLYTVMNLKSILEQYAVDGATLFFPKGTYNVTEKIILANISDVTFNFEDGASIHDTANAFAKDNTGVNFRVRYGIHFIECSDIKFNNARAGNDSIPFSNITERVEKLKVNPLLNFEGCKGVRLDTISLYGTVGPYITQRNSDGTIYTEDTIRSSFVRFLDTDDIYIDHPTLEDNSGGGEIFTAYRCTDIEFYNPHHHQEVGGTTWWSLGDFIQCNNTIIDKVFDIHSLSTGNMFDVSGENIVIGNVDCYYPNGTIVDTTHEWGMDSGVSRDVTLRNMNYISPDKAVNSGLLSSVNSDVFLTDAESKVLDETNEQRRLLIEKCAVKGSQFLVSVKPFREVTVRDTYVEDVDFLNVLEKYPSTSGDYACDYLFDNLDFVKINKTTETTLESFGRTVVKNSKLTLNNTPIRVVDRLALYSGIPNLHNSKGEIVFENCVISGAIFRVGSNLEFNNCKLINCYFVTVDYHGTRPNIRFTNGTRFLFNNTSTAPRPLFDFTSGGVHSLEFVDSHVGGEYLNDSGYALVNGVDKLLNFSLVRSKWTLRSTASSDPDLYKQRPVLYLTNGNTIKVLIDGGDVKETILRVISSAGSASGKIEIDIRNSDLKRPNDGIEARSIISLQGVAVGGASLNTIDANIVYSQFRGTQASYFDTTVKALGGNSRMYNVLEY